MATLQIRIPPSQRPAINALFLALATIVGFGLEPVFVGLLSDANHGSANALKMSLRLITGGATVACLLVSLFFANDRKTTGSSFA